MIDNVLGIDTEGGKGDIMVFAIEGMYSDDFFASLQYFITQGTGQSSMFLIPFALYVI